MPYNEEKDRVLMACEHFRSIKITEGMSFIALPHDGHKAVRHTKKQQVYTKVVVKLII